MLLPPALKISPPLLSSNKREALVTGEKTQVIIVQKYQCMDSLCTQKHNQTKPFPLGSKLSMINGFVLVSKITIITVGIL